MRQGWGWGLGELTAGERKRENLRRKKVGGFAGSVRVKGRGGCHTGFGVKQGVGKGFGRGSGSGQVSRRVQLQTCGRDARMRIVVLFTTLSS